MYLNVKLLLFTLLHLLYLIEQFLQSLRIGPCFLLLCFYASTSTLMIQLECYGMMMDAEQKRADPSMIFILVSPFKKTFSDSECNNLGALSLLTLAL
jgi:hypothetical protein